MYDGKQPKTFGLNILIFFNLLAFHIEYILLSEHYGQSTMCLLYFNSFSVHFV